MDDGGCICCGLAYAEEGYDRCRPCYERCDVEYPYCVLREDEDG